MTVKVSINDYSVLIKYPLICGPKVGITYEAERALEMEHTHPMPRKMVDLLIDAIGRKEWVEAAALIDQVHDCFLGMRMVIIKQEDTWPEKEKTMIKVTIEDDEKLYIRLLDLYERARMDALPLTPGTPRTPSMYSVSPTPTEEGKEDGHSKL